MVKKTADLQAIKGVILVCIFIFGGLTGVAILIYDWFKRSNYKPNTLIEVSTVLKKFGTFVCVLILVNFLPFISVGIIENDALKALLPFIVQSVIGVVITQKYLHKYNIYLTSDLFWQALEGQDLGRAFAALNLEKKSKRDAQLTANKKNISTLHYEPPKTMSPPPILVDQSGDKNRVILIICAVTFLLTFLGYQYFSNNSEAVLKKIEQAVHNLEYAEGSGLTPETSILPSE